MCALNELVNIIIVSCARSSSSVAVSCPLYLGHNKWKHKRDLAFISPADSEKKECAQTMQPYSNICLIDNTTSPLLHVCTTVWSAVCTVLDFVCACVCVQTVRPTLSVNKNQSVFRPASLCLHLSCLFSSHSLFTSLLFSLQHPTVM